MILKLQVCELASYTDTFLSNSYDKNVWLQLHSKKPALLNWHFLPISKGVTVIKQVCNKQELWEVLIMIPHESAHP